MDPAHIAQLTAAATRAGMLLLGAAVLLGAGLLLIRLALRLAAAGLARGRADPTLARYLLSALRAGLYLALAMAVLGQLGLRLGPLAALALGLSSAIGLALSGLFGDFAAGLALLLLRPFEVGETIVIGAGDDAIEGEVLAIGTLRTLLLDGDNALLSVPNSAITDATLANRSRPAWIGVERILQLPAGVDVDALAPGVAAAFDGLPGLVGPPPAVQREPDGRAGPRLRIAYGCPDDAADSVAFALNRRLAPLILPVGAAATAAGLGRRLF